jgi:hypothetical protein
MEEAARREEEAIAVTLQEWKLLLAYKISPLLCFFFLLPPSVFLLLLPLKLVALMLLDGLHVLGIR